MATMQAYSTVASRNLIRAEGKMLKHAENRIVLGKFGEQKSQPLNKTDTVTFRRLIPFNAGSNEVASITAASFATTEGTTPTANSIDYTDVSATLSQYAVLFKFSSKVAYMYEDDIPEDMKRLTGQTLGSVAEMVAYGKMKAGSSVIYATGSTRVAQAAPISLNLLRKAARTMESNHADPVTTAIKPGPNYGTSAVEESYVVFVHTDVVADCRDLTGFTKRVDYGTAIKPVHEREFGECEGFRFVSSPMFAPFAAGGAAVGVTGMLAADDTNCDVYPTIVIAQDCIGHISLKGHGVTGISPTLIPASEKNHANPSGMFGYVGADFWYECVRTNENWMTRIEHCASDLA